MTDPAERLRAMFAGRNAEELLLATLDAALAAAYQRGQSDERERIRAAMGVPLWHSTVPVAYFRADDVAAILDAGADR